jgi:hypothetical protein
VPGDQAFPAVQPVADVRPTCIAQGGIRVSTEATLAIAAHALAATAADITTTGHTGTTLCTHITTVGIAGITTTPRYRMTFTILPVTDTTTRTSPPSRSMNHSSRHIPNMTRATLSGMYGKESSVKRPSLWQESTNT